MDHHEGHSRVMDPHAGHKMSEPRSHDRHAGHSVAMFRDKFWLSLALTVPVVFWSADIQQWLGYTAPSFPGSKLIAPILGAIVFVYGGLVFVRGAWNELADRKPGMMTLISLAITVAFATSLAATLGLFEIDVWWELATLITIMVLGHWLEMRAISQAHGALSALAALLPDISERVSGGKTQIVPIAELRTGDVVLVRPGTRIPADGKVVEGAADVDESMVTGESRTVSKGPGAAVIAGTVTSGGSLRVSITAVGEKTALSGIMRLVAAAQTSGSRTQALADRAAAILFYVAVASGAITMTYWWLAGDKEHALIRTATVLIIACPHALGLAIPLVIAISTSLGAQNGLLVKDRLALERARSLDMVIFDKIGTLTRGSPVLSGVAAAPGTNEGDLLAYAAAVEANSEHPLARAVVAEAKRRNLAIFQATNFEAQPGRGAQALVNGKTIVVGGPRLLTEAKVAVPPEVEKLTAPWASDGKTILYVVAKGQLLGAFAVEDEIRPESREAVTELHKLGIRVAMITGDSNTVAESVGKRIGIDEIAAEVLPADKASAVKRFQEGGTALGQYKQISANRVISLKDEAGFVFEKPGQYSLTVEFSMGPPGKFAPFEVQAKTPTGSFHAKVSFCIEACIIEPLQVRRSTPRSALDAVRVFYTYITRYQQLGVPSGRAKKALWPLLSKRLAKQLDSLEACDEDYYRRYGEILRAKTYKPATPWLEEGLFTGPDATATPRTFRILGSRAIGEKRVDVLIAFKEDWGDSEGDVTAILERKRWVIDDYVAMYENDELQRLSAGYSECDGGKWVGEAPF